MTDTTRPRIAPLAGPTATIQKPPPLASAPVEKAGQPFYPDGSRSFEEVDRLRVGADCVATLLSDQVDIDFIRVLPPSSYPQGLAARQRTDESEGDVLAKERGRDYFADRPYHLSVPPSHPSLAQIASCLQKLADSGAYDGLLSRRGSPQIEKTLYWFNPLVDTDLPICGCAAQRAQGEISTAGPKIIVDRVICLASKSWADDEGRNRRGAVLLQGQQIFTAHDVTKVDAWPGGFLATGGH